MNTHTSHTCMHTHTQTHKLEEFESKSADNRTPKVCENLKHRQYVKIYYHLKVFHGYKNIQRSQPLAKCVDSQIGNRCCKTVITVLF